VFVHFIPLDSFANDKSVVNVQINDFRRTNSTAVRACKIDNTMGYNILFCLDYCVETRDAKKLTLSFSCPTKNFQEGVSWATVKVVAQVQFLSFPKRVPLVETLGVQLFSDTDLENFACDPRELDLVLTPNALQRLREANGRGEIENLTVPKNDKQEIVTAKTILGNNFDEEEVGSQIERMKEIALLRERQNQAREANKKKLEEIKEEPIIQIPDAGHKRVFSGSTINMSPTVESDRGDVLEDIEFGESISEKGDSQSETDAQLKAFSASRGVRFSG